MKVPILYKSAEEALSIIQSGNRIYIHGSAQTPTFLLKALTSHASRLKNVELVSISVYGDIQVDKPEYAGIFHINSFFVSASIRKAVNEGYADYVPIFLSEIPELFYQKILPQPMSGLVAGITLGSKRSLTAEFWDKVKKVGVAHVVVASGTNITFVVSFIFGVTAFYLPRGKSILIVILSIVLYLFLSGFEAPLIRAAIMAFVTFWSQTEGRLVSARRNLFLTAGIMLIVEPDWINDLGFILSFVSTASIMVFGKKISKFLQFAPNILKESFSTSLAAQIGVAPILFVTFGQFNLLSPFINALVLWTIPLIMILGALGGGFGLIFPFLGKLILYVCYPLTWWFAKIVEIF